MKKITQMLSIAAAAGVAYKVLTHKKEDGTSLLDQLSESTKGWTDKLNQYMSKIQDKLIPGMKGPNGEDVYRDMYKRSYYKSQEGSRTYMDDNVH